MILVPQLLDVYTKPTTTTNTIKKRRKKECNINSHKLVANLEKNVSITNKVVVVVGIVTYLMEKGR